MNRERLLLDAKAQAAVLAETGYTAPQPRTQIPAPGTAALATLETGHLSDGRGRLRFGARPESCPLGGVHSMRRACYARERSVSEQYLLDLEREAFLSLCGERKTQERIAYTLKTGKPLRN